MPARPRRHRPRPLPRLTEPLVRDAGVLRPASWEEALERAADGFRNVLDSDHSGADRGSDRGSAIGLFSCSKSTNELNFLAQKLARTALNTNNIDSCNRT